MPSDNTDSGLANPHPNEVKDDGKGTAEVYVYQENNHIEAFAGIDNGYIAGIFVSESMRSRGIGRLLLGKCKEIYPKLSLCVYAKNERSVKFYLREGFVIETKQNDINTGEREYFMTWNK